jgi:biopolymer transport protein ExbD
MLKSKSNRQSPSLNASSMADIAFLLLVFFLTSTEISKEEGLLVKLPAYQPEATQGQPVAPRNLFTVLINDAGDLMVRDQRIQISELRDLTAAFIANPEDLPSLAQSPLKAVVSIKPSVNTPYASYLAVYNELMAAYSSLWDQQAYNRYGVADFDELSKQEQSKILSEIPFKLSEIEPNSVALSTSLRPRG